MKTLALIAGLVLLLSIPAVAFAQGEQSPARFGGSVTVDGEAAADGIVVAAFVGVDEIGSDEVEGGRYRIDVSHTAALQGNEVTFTVGDLAAAETFTFASGIHPLNLTASSASSTEQSPRPPAVYGGTVTLDGNQAHDGTAVTAWINGAVVSSATVTGGRYRIDIGYGSSYVGTTISFQVDGNVADQALTFGSGIMSLHLTASSFSRACEDVFADLIEAGVLVNVFRYNNVEKTWVGYNPAVPELSDLETVDVFDSLWVEVTADTAFQDQGLTTGWNNVTVRR